MKVFLLGAGPGDPGLLTLKARDVLSRADVVVYDYLVGERLLMHCRESAERIYAGKRGGDHSIPQDEINALLVRLAQEGKVVARLKGGDPYVFGRGAEEAEALQEAGVEFEVVPGVTSGVAAPTYAGIPLTHRKCASSVTFVTGHEDPTKPESVHDWAALARSGSTLVFYMGMENLEHIAAKLLECNLSPDTPAAVVQRGTTSRQRSLVSTLAKLAPEARALGFTPPAIIIVGHVCALAPKLDWFGEKPLLGKGVVVTRAREQASDLVTLLEEQGACCLELPTISVQPLDDYAKVEEAILRLPDYDWIVFTSVNGVNYFWTQLEEIGLDTRMLGGIDVAAIGPATAEALRQRGVHPDFIPDTYVAESVVQGLIEHGATGKHILIPRAREAREVLPEELRKAGAHVDVLPVYEAAPSGTPEQRDQLLEQLAVGEMHYITFASSSTVDNFFALVHPDHIKQYRNRIKLACIGPITAKTLEGYGFQTDIQPTDFTIPALVTAMGQDAQKNRRNSRRKPF